MRRTVRRGRSTAVLPFAGDARRGQFLVVWAIAEGREVDRCLMGETRLP